MASLSSQPGQSGSMLSFMLYWVNECLCVCVCVCESERSVSECVLMCVFLSRERLWNVAAHHAFLTITIVAFFIQCFFFSPLSVSLLVFLDLCLFRSLPCSFSYVLPHGPIKSPVFLIYYRGFCFSLWQGWGLEWHVFMRINGTSENFSDNI